MVRVKSGGGISMNKVVQSRSGQKVEPKTQAGNQAGAAQTGLSHQFKPEPMFQGKGYEPKAMGSTGIANARQGPAGAGPGGMGRTIYRSGSQGVTPPATEMPKGHDILSDYGPEKRR